MPYKRGQVVRLIRPITEVRVGEAPGGRAAAGDNPGTADRGARYNGASNPDDIRAPYQRASNPGDIRARYSRALRDHRCGARYTPDKRAPYGWAWG